MTPVMTHMTHLTTHLTTHSRLITESIMLYDFPHDSSLSQLCFLTPFTTHLWVNYALLPYSLPYDSLMSQLWFNNFLGFIYDSKVVSTTHTWVSFLDRMSQSGSATETSVEYKRDPISAPKEEDRPRLTVLANLPQSPFCVHSALVFTHILLGQYWSPCCL